MFVSVKESDLVIVLLITQEKSVPKQHNAGIIIEIAKNKYI